MDTDKTPDLPRPGPQSGWRYLFSSLENRDFRYLWFGLVFMMGAVQMQTIARSYLAYEITSSPLLLGVVNMGFALPMLSLALFGGVVADRLDKKRVVQWAQAAAAAVALFVAVSITTESVTWVHLFVASMFQGVLFSFLMPARQAIIRDLVGVGRLSNAIALNAAAMSVITLAAPALAGGLYVWIGADGVYYVVSAMGIAALVITGFIGNVEGVQAKPGTHALADIKAGLSYIWQSPLVVVLLFMGLATAMLAMPFRLLLPIFVVDVYHRGPEALGLLVSIMGLGSLAGAVFVVALGHWRRGLLLIGGSFVSGVALLMVALFPYYLAAAAIMVLLGLGDAAHRALNQSLIMEQVEQRYSGRVMSVYMMNFGLMPLGILPASLIAQLASGEAAVATLAILLLATSTAILVTQRRLRELQ